MFLKGSAQEWDVIAGIVSKPKAVIRDESDASRVAISLDLTGCVLWQRYLQDPMLKGVDMAYIRH